MVAPPTDIFVPLRLHGPHHGRAGEDTDVVATRADAFRQLALDPRPSSRSGRFSGRGAPASLAPPKG